MFTSVVRARHGADVSHPSRHAVQGRDGVARIVPAGAPPDGLPDTVPQEAVVRARAELDARDSRRLRPVEGTRGEEPAEVRLPSHRLGPYDGRVEGDDARPVRGGTRVEAHGDDVGDVPAPGRRWEG
ncbi:hypothetical protein THAOC_08543 [Thalassiosira oceanica]|uniref:Uncharacterized protein n=1 Tax=Thalassiosira oceanica TaxID=159749 RepID=K0SYS1_THAOC|nr:hypothetical protein THAOC_08543 [Thalassiosira oceanica]|eukprot:EJK70124.1 hypothetical protein THAOC_08543 [Thalassiosira oceanica]